MQSHLFKITLVIVFVLGMVSSLQINPQSKNDVQFSHSLIETLAGIVDLTFEGEFDPENLQANHLGAFVRIADQIFPIFESMGLTEKHLEYSEKFCYDYGWLSGCTGFTFEFYIGWHVDNGTFKDFEYLNVTYVPYVRGVGTVFLTAETWALKFQTDLASRFVNIEVPISTQMNFYQAIQFCYDGNAEIYDPTVLFTFETSVKS
jgi:hypothetical protein